MRVISGYLKGRRLVSFKADHIRPTTDRVKGSIFNTLMGEIPESRVLDLFSGTGNLAIEAISRGAKEAHCVDFHSKSLFVLNQNLSHLGICDKVQVYRVDVFLFLKKYSGDPFDIIFIDPPFKEQLADSVLESLSNSRACQNMTTVVIESAQHEKIDKAYGPLIMIGQRDFGDKRVSYFKIGSEN